MVGLPGDARWFIDYAFVEAYFDVEIYALALIGTLRHRTIAAAFAHGSRLLDYHVTLIRHAACLTNENIRCRFQKQPCASFSFITAGHAVPLGAYDRAFIAASPPLRIFCIIVAARLIATKLRFRIDDQRHFHCRRLHDIYRYWDVFITTGTSWRGAHSK